MNQNSLPVIRSGSRAVERIYINARNRNRSPTPDNRHQGLMEIIERQHNFKNARLPFLVLVGDKEFVQLLPPEIELVRVVLLDSVRVRYGVVLGRQELL